MSAAAIIGTVAAVASTAITAYSVYAQGQQQSQANETNARIAEIQAQQARDAARIDAENQALAAKRAQATVRARAAASGIEPSVGSPLLTIMDNARQAELEKQRILHGGELRATGLLSGANVSRSQGAAAASAGRIGAGINLLSGVSGIANQYRKSGVGSELSGI